MYELEAMSGSGAQKRSQALARQVHSLSALGHTHRQIAEAVGKQPHQIANLIAKGERLKSLDAAPSPQEKK